MCIDHLFPPFHIYSISFCQLLEKQEKREYAIYCEITKVKNSNVTKQAMLWLKMHPTL